MGYYITATVKQQCSVNDMRYSAIPYQVVCLHT